MLTNHSSHFTITWLFSKFLSEVFIISHYKSQNYQEHVSYTSIFKLCEFVSYFTFVKIGAFSV